MRVYSSQIAGRLFDALLEEGPSCYDETWCGCGQSFQLLLVRLRWEMYYTKLTELGLELVEKGLDNKKVMEELNWLNRRADVVLDGYVTHDLCKECQQMNSSIKAFQVDYCPRYCSALRKYMKVRDLPCIQENEVYDMGDKMLLPKHYEEEYHFKVHKYRNEDMGELSKIPRYKCLTDLEFSVLSLAMDLSRKSTTK